MTPDVTGRVVRFIEVCLLGCRRRPWAALALSLTVLTLVATTVFFHETPAMAALALAGQGVLAVLALGWTLHTIAQLKWQRGRLTTTLIAVLVGLLGWIGASALLEYGAHFAPDATELWLPANGLGLAGVVCLILAAFQFPRANARRTQYLYQSLDLAIAMMAAVYVAWAALLGPALAQTSPTDTRDLTVVWVEVGETAVPLMLAWAGFRLMFGVYPEGLRVTAPTLGVSFVLFSAQAALTSPFANAFVTTPHWVDHVLRTGALAFAIAAIAHARAVPVETDVVLSDDVAATRWPWRSLVALGTLWAVYGFFVTGAEHYAQDFIEGNYTTAALLFGLLFALSGIQQVIEIFSRVRLARRLQTELTQRESAEAQLQTLNAQLEERVGLRTSELAEANAHLRQEVEDRTRAEDRLRESEARLLHDAFHDALTGLPNRALLLDRIGRALERARRHIDYRFALLFLDFDGFRVINDSLGHTLGDAVLIENARRLQLGLRGIDTLARLGGDEFVALVDDVDDEAAAIAVAERLQTALALPFDGQGQRLYTTASIGIVLSSAFYETAQDLLRDAEVTMYHAKALGRSRYAVFNAGMRARAIARLVLENELRQALERGELTLHYQPILDLRTDRITGFEALVRWRHPYRGLVPPGEFIPVAEETGSIVPIGHWVLREAAAQLARWRQNTENAQGLTMSVNLSARQLREKDLASQVGLALMQAGLEPEALKVEITETALVDDAEQALITLEALRALGVQVQIDDFGTGYSSLSYLQRFPVDTLKIDRSFVGRISAGDDSVEIVRSIVNLAHGLGLTVIAEGVETQEQLNFIKALACELGQGYLISKPLEAERAFEYIVRPEMAMLV